MFFNIFLAFCFNFFLSALCRVLLMVSKGTSPGNRVTTSSWSGLLTSDWLASSSSPNKLRPWFYCMQWYLLLDFGFDFFTWISSGSLLFLFSFYLFPFWINSFWRVTRSRNTTIIFLYIVSKKSNAEEIDYDSFNSSNGLLCVYAHKA